MIIFEDDHSRNLIILSPLDIEDHQRKGIVRNGGQRGLVKAIKIGLGDLLLLAVCVDKNRYRKSALHHSAVKICTARAWVDRGHACG
jgi:hypothetical protein